MLRTFLFAAFALAFGILSPLAPDTARAQSKGDAEHILGAPESIGMIDADEIVIDYSWIGLAEPRNLSYTLRRTGGSFEVDGGGVEVDREIVNGLLSAGERLRPVSTPLSCIGHTDDYPNFSVRMRRDGSDLAQFDSTSNCARHLPWNVTVDDRLLAQYDGSIWQRLHAVLVAVDASEWRERVPRSDDAAFVPLIAGRSWGGPYQDEALAARLVSLFVADATFQAHFVAAEPTIETVYCKAIEFTDCTTIDVQAEVSRAGNWSFEFDSRVDATGPVSYVLPDERQYEALDTFLASPLMNVANEMSGGAAVSVDYRIDNSRYPDLIAEWLQVTDPVDDRARAAFAASPEGQDFRIRFFPAFDIAVIRTFEPEARTELLQRLGASEEVREALEDRRNSFPVRLDGTVLLVER